MHVRVATTYSYECNDEAMHASDVSCSTMLIWLSTQGEHIACMGEVNQIETDKQLAIPADRESRPEGAAGVRAIHRSMKVIFS
eukprot:scaffold230498_cov25-Prasinocladus_malaysianus.AAC.1